MITDSCRVIVSCFLDNRSSRNNSPPNKQSCLSFLKKVIDKEISLKSKISYDLIIINHDTGFYEGNEYLKNLNNTKTNNGKIITETIPNAGISFDGYNYAFKKFKDKYENWIFSEDDHLLYENNYYDILLEEYESKKNKNIGFLAFAPISHNFQFVHSGGGFGLTKKQVLNKIVDKFGSLPCYSAGHNITSSEIFFTNYVIQVGFELLLLESFSCYPKNYYRCKDHELHRNLGIYKDLGKYFFQVGIDNGEEW